jgi:hypothetical protein
MRAPTTTPLLACFACVCTLVVDTGARAADLSPRTCGGAPEGAAPPASGLRESSGYLTLAPAIVGITFMGAPIPSYQWGLDGGYHLARGRSFAMQAGAFFEHMPTPLQFFRFGAVGRFGGGDERIFGYGLLRLGAYLERLHDGLPVRPGLHTTVGGGVMGMLHRVVGLGGEVSAELIHGGTGAGPVFLDLRVFLALKF